MVDKRSGNDRRINPDRRKGERSSYNGYEKREIEYRRLEISRREKEISD